VADVQLFDFGNRGDQGNIGDGQSVAGVHGKSDSRADGRRFPQRLDRARISRPVRVLAGVELDRRRAKLPGPFDGAPLWGDEQTRANPDSGQPSEPILKPPMVARYVQPALGRDLLATLRDEGDLMGSQPLGDSQHLVAAGHLEVEHGTDAPCQTLDVVVLNVPTVLAEMGRDAVGASALTDSGRFDGVRLGAAARLSDRRDVIDVDIEALIAKWSRTELGPTCCLCVWHESTPRTFKRTPRGDRTVMKKLSIALVLVAACHSGAGRPEQAIRPAGAPFASGSGGAATARGAIAGFLAAARNEDLQAMASLWGTATGPARNTIPRDELEKRELIMMCYLRHDRYSLVSEGGSTGGQRRIEVELERGMLIRRAAFMVVPGSDSRWYVQSFDMDALRDFCAKRPGA
jgi:hypothetical protein